MHEARLAEVNCQKPRCWSRVSPHSLQRALPVSLLTVASGCLLEMWVGNVQTTGGDPYMMGHVTSLANTLT